MIESRHLGLVTPGEIENLRERLQKLAESLAEDTLDIDGILALAEMPTDLNCDRPQEPDGLLLNEIRIERKIRIGVARDEAFCFYYEDNLELLQELEAEVVTFSPLHEFSNCRKISAVYFLEADIRNSMRKI